MNKNLHEVRMVRSQDIDDLVILCAEHAKYEGSDYQKEGKASLLFDYLFSSNSPLECLVVEDSQKNLVGFCTFMKQFSTWDASFYVYMDCLYLKEHCRGMGIGKELMSRITDFAKTHNCSVIQWQTPTSNSRAIRFYHRLGAESKTKERFFLQA